MRQDRTSPGQRTEKRARIKDALKSDVGLDIPFLRDTPKYMQVACRVTFVFLMFLGLLISAKQETGEPGVFAKYMLVWLLLAAGTVAAMLITYHIMDRFTSKHAQLMLRASYAAEGFNSKLPQYITAMHPIALLNDRLLALFLNVMAENYSALPPLYMWIGKHRRTQRQEAMLHLCKMREQMMNGRPDRAYKLFTEQHLLMDAAYAEQPDLTEQQLSPGMTDDALCYYETAAGFCTRTGQLAEAGHYRECARLRISLHDADEQPFLEEILDISLGFAAGEAEAQHDRMIALEQRIKETFQLMQRGKYNNLKRRLEQAAIFTAITPPGVEDGAARDKERFARRLPGEDYLSGS